MSYRCRTEDRFQYEKEREMEGNVKFEIVVQHFREELWRILDDKY
jgi:hypothetical protein